VSQPSTAPWYVGITLTGRDRVSPCIWTAPHNFGS